MTPQRATAAALWAAARPDADPVAVAAALDDPALDPALLVDAAAAQRVAPLVLASLRDASRLDRLGAGAARLRGEADQWHARALLVPRVLSLAVAPLSAAGLTPLVLKGAALAERYPAARLRPMEDVDLLLPASAHAPAVLALIAAGWRVTAPLDRLRHDTVLEHPDAPGLPLELHASLERWYERAGRLGTSELWRARVPRRILGVDAWGLPVEEEALLLAAHAGKPYHCFDRLVWSVDVAVVLRAAMAAGGIDWDRLRHLATRSRRATVLAVALHHATRLGAPPVPAPLLILPEAGWRRAAMAPLLDAAWPLQPPDGRTRHALRYALSDGLGERVRLLAGERPDLPAWSLPLRAGRGGTAAVRRWVTLRRGAVVRRRPRPALMVASVALSVGLRLVPAPALWTTVERLCRRPRSGARTRRSVASLAADVDAVLGSRLPGVRGRCLKRSLLLYALLRRDGHAPRWVVGHRLAADGRLLGHAWCVVDGVPVGEPEEGLAAYRPLLVREAA